MIDNFMTDANTVKNIVLAAMINEGYISDEKAHEFADKYVVIVSKKSWFERTYNRFFKNRKSDGYYYDVVKYVTSPQPYPSSNTDESNLDAITDVERLEELLMEASRKEMYELAAQITRRIEKLKNNKK